MRDPFASTENSGASLPATPRDATESAAASRRAFLQNVARAVGVLIAVPFISKALRAQTNVTNANELATTTTVRRSSAVAVTVYKDPTCGCCKEWVKHMQKAGFTVTATDTTDMNAIKAKYGVPTALASCHTALVGDYIVEGHAPADVVQKMLTEKPNARGIAVPGNAAGFARHGRPNQGQIQRHVV